MPDQDEFSGEVGANPLHCLDHPLLSPGSCLPSVTRRHVWVLHGPAYHSGEVAGWKPTVRPLRFTELVDNLCW